MRRRIFFALDGPKGGFFLGLIPNVPSSMKVNENTCCARSEFRCTKALCLYLLFFAIVVSSSLADTVKDREGAVRKDRASLENDARWIYNDYKRGFAEAKRTGKPLLVVLRCIPCLACAGIDSAVLLQETDLAPLLDQFVCVRVIDANTLDLKL